jgi:ActR/RegA family two-component response regulator
MDARVFAQPAAARLSFVVEPRNQGLSHRANRPTLLIATDDDDLHEIVNEAARTLSCAAALVRSGGEAMTSARSHPPGLMVLDQCLPDLAGLEVARALSRDTPELRFVLIGSGLTTSTTVEAMKLGAFTVLEKPVALNEIAATIRSAVVETLTPTPPTAHTTTAVQCAPRSTSERWALHVLKACEADGDLRTLGAWASFAGLSYSSLCESCRLVGIQPLHARDLTRVLSAVVRSRLYDCRVEELFDISDRRTLKTLMTRAGLVPEGDGHKVSVEQFLGSQRFVPSTNAGLAVLRALLLR